MSWNYRYFTRDRLSFSEVQFSAGIQQMFLKIISGNACLYSNFVWLHRLEAKAHQQKKERTEKSTNLTIIEEIFIWIYRYRSNSQRWGSSGYKSKSITTRPWSPPVFPLVQLFTLILAIVSPRSKSVLIFSQVVLQWNFRLCISVPYLFYKTSNSFSVIIFSKCVAKALIVIVSLFNFILSEGSGNAWALSWTIGGLW